MSQIIHAKAAVTDDAGSFTIEDIAVHPPGIGEVRVAVRASPDRSGEGLHPADRFQQTVGRMRLVHAKSFEKAPAKIDCCATFQA